MMSAARQLALNPIEDGHSYSINIRTQDIPMQQPGAKIIASSEGFSWAFCNNPERQENLPRLHLASSQMLGHSNLCDSILIMVRNPVDYMRALHEQSIKEGGHESFGAFYRQQRKLIESTINLSLILEAYDRYFDKIVILSSDELRHTPDVFWDKYRSRLSAPKPMQTSFLEASRGLSSNKSLGGEKLYCLAVLNRYANMIQSTFEGLEDYKNIFPAEYSNFKKAYPNVTTWMNRRIAEFSTADDLSRLSQKLKEEKNKQDRFQEVVIDQEMANFIESNFIQPIERLKTIDEETIAGYRISLESVVQ
jgi:hypothetical protein